MAKLKKGHHQKLSEFVREKDIISVINKFLSDNDMGDFEVGKLKIQLKDDQLSPQNLVCGPGYHIEWYCTIDGGCKKRCVADY